MLSPFISGHLNQRVFWREVFTVKALLMGWVVLIFSTPLAGLAETADDLEVLGDGSQTRNFVHRNDVADFVLLTLRKPAVGWFTLVSPLDLRLSELAETLLNLQGVQRKICYRPEYLCYEPSPLRKPDTDWLRNLGWKPQIQSLPHGLGL